MLRNFKTVIVAEKPVETHTPVVLENCLLTGAPVLSQNFDSAEYDYLVEIDGQVRNVRLAAYDYANCGWFQYNKLRVMNKVRKYGHWDYLAKGMRFTELQDYFVAPPDVL